MIYRFGDCELDTKRLELRRQGAAQPVEPQVFELLRCLIERPDQFVSKDEIFASVWQGRIVSDAALSSRVKAARTAIGDTGSEQRLIRTVHGRGFRFVAPVVIDADDERAYEEVVGGGMPAACPQRSSATAEFGTAAALLSADLHHHGLLTGDGLPASAETHLLARRNGMRQEIERLAGTIKSDTGGSLSAEFDDAADAVHCAVEILRRFGMNHSGSAEQMPLPRIAVTAAGDGSAAAVALAGRLQCLGAPGEIVMARAVEDAVRDRMMLTTTPVEDEWSVGLGVSLVRLTGAGLAALSEEAAAPLLRCAVPREPSIAVLPFTALGNTDDAAALAEGLRIDIQNALVKISGILVIAVASANAFRGQPPARSATAMGVRYMLHGIVQMAGERARISMELVDGASGSIAWAERFDCTFTDTFAVQDEITSKVIAALDVKLLRGEQARIWHTTLSEPKAVRLFYHGVREFYRMERDAMAEARRSFEALAELWPNSPVGFTWAALSHWIDYVRRWGSSREESKAMARRWATEAVAMPDADGQAHTIMAHVHLMDRKFDAALEMGEAAVAVRPGCANANGFYGNVLHYCGEQERAIAHVRRAIRFSPVYPPFFANILASAYLLSEQPEAAMGVAKEVLRLKPGDIQSRLVLVAAAQMTGNRELAGLFAREVRTLDPGFSGAAFYADQPYREARTIASVRDAMQAAGLLS